MSRKTTTALVLTLVLGVVLVGTAATVDWGSGDTIHSIPFNPAEGDDTALAESLNHALFEEYGPVVMVMGLLMFAAILGGVYLAKEDLE